MPLSFYPDSDRPQQRINRSLQAIAEQDAQVQAFSWKIDPTASTIEPTTGPLEGLAFGVKDVIDVAGMPTRCGSLATDPKAKTFDSACVATLRASGAVPVGKTVTAEFAFTTPGPTRNPHRLDYTPGGSSSGSAAAVAAGMVDMTLGTQTGGSIIRPAAYCGVVGYKPTFGRVHRVGMHVLCDSLDTIGWFTRTVAQSQAIASILIPQEHTPTTRHPPKVAVLNCKSLEALSPSAQGALLDCVQRLQNMGATIVQPELDDDVDALTQTHGLIMRFELSRGLFPIVKDKEYLVSEAARNVVRTGLAIEHSMYTAQQFRRQQLATRWLAQFADCDFIVAPSTPGTAPSGLASTGSSVFNRLWSLLGWPCIHLPTAADEGKLPVGVQWIGLPDTDTSLLGWAAALHSQLDVRQEQTSMLEDV